MRCFIPAVLLFVASVVLAQPLAGPFTVWEAGADTTLADLHLALGAPGRVDLFYTARAAVTSATVVRHAAWALETQSAATEALLTYGPWRWDVNDAAADGAGAWVLLLSGDAGGGGASDSNRTLLLRGGQTLLESAVLHDGLTHEAADASDTYLRDGRVISRPGGGVALSAILHGEYVIPGTPATENDDKAWFRLYPAGSLVSDFRDSVYNAAEPVLIGVDIAAAGRDALKAAVWRSSITETQLAEIPGEEGGGELYPCFTLCPTEPRLWRTRGGRTLFSSNWTVEMHNPANRPPASVFHIDLDSEDLLRLGPLGVDTLDAVAFQPDYGFASLQLDPGTITLGRADTNATLVQPAGLLQSLDAGWDVVEAQPLVTPDGQVIVLWSERETAPPQRMRLRLATVGWETPLAVGDHPAELQPFSFSLHPFPNPFNSELAIRYELPHAQAVELAIYNLAGQQVAIIEQGLQPAGSHRAAWSAGECASGVYWVRLRGAARTQTAKVLLLK